MARLVKAKRFMAWTSFQVVVLGILLPVTADAAGASISWVHGEDSGPGPVRRGDLRVCQGVLLEGRLQMKKAEDRSPAFWWKKI